VACSRPLAQQLNGTLCDRMAMKRTPSNPTELAKITSMKRTPSNPTEPAEIMSMGSPPSTWTELTEITAMMCTSSNSTELSEIMAIRRRPQSTTCRLTRTPEGSPALSEAQTLFTRQSTPLSRKSGGTSCVSIDSVSKRDLVVQLHRAELEACRATVRHYLIKHGFPDDDVNSRKRIRWGTAFTYPLHVAAASLDEAMVRNLLKLGADVTSTDSSGSVASKCFKRRLSTSCFSSRTGWTAAEESKAARILDQLQSWKANPHFARASPLMPDSHKD